MRRFVPVAAPVLNGNERKYVLDCLESTWISSSGKYVELFEERFAEFCRAKYAIACSNGTTALHLALLALGVGPGDEIIVPTLTFVATANAVVYCGARPVFVDSEPATWNLAPNLLENKITARTRGIIVVHLYGHPVDMDAVLAVAQRHSLFVIEDAAEAHGAEYKGRRVGSLGNVAAFSFYGNKIITTGEGGMVVTNEASLARKVRQFKGQGVDPERRYWFPVVGYNYRLTNIAAAIGLAQLENVEWHIKRRREVATWYHQQLDNAPALVFQANKEWATHVYWMFNILLAHDSPLDRDKIMTYLTEEGIETRPIFYPIHTLPPYQSLSQGEAFPTAERIAARGITLPTWAGLTEEEVVFVCRTLLGACKRQLEDANT